MSTDVNSDVKAAPETTAEARRPFVVPWAVIIGVVVLIVGFGVALARSGLTQVDSGPAPDFALTTFDGQRFKLSEQRGKVVVVNFWASWCGPCRSEAPLLNQLYADYKARGVSFIGVDYLDNQSDAAAYIKDAKVSYPVAPDEGTRASSAYRVKGVPETYVVDAQGNLAFTLPLPLDRLTNTDLRAKLDALLTPGTKAAP